MRASVAALAGIIIGAAGGAGGMYAYKGLVPRPVAASDLRPVKESLTRLQARLASGLTQSDFSNLVGEILTQVRLVKEGDLAEAQKNAIQDALKKASEVAEFWKSGLDGDCPKSCDKIVEETFQRLGALKSGERLETVYAPDPLGVLGPKYYFQAHSLVLSALMQELSSKLSAAVQSI